MIRWFVSPARYTQDGIITRRSPSMIARYPYEQWAGVLSNDKICFLLRWVQTEPFDIFPLDGVELTSPEQWAEFYMKYPELSNRWEDQPLCRMI